MLNFQNVTLRRGAQILLKDVTFTVQPGERWGIVGRNGSGKSSLMALIHGTRNPNLLQPDQGDVRLSPQLSLAHVAQETPASERTALEYVMDGDAELRQLEQRLAQAEHDHNGELQAQLHAHLETIDAYTAPSRAARLLTGLGFLNDQLQTPVKLFSGGWRMRLNLAQALMCRSDMLLLDEPTNHLDLDAVLWLQNWLQGYPGTVLLISHDRDFLDTCVDHIVLLENQQLHVYTGNYTDFEHQHAMRLAQQQAAHRKQQRTIEHIQSFVDRFRAKATKAKQAQSRLKALERLEVIAPAHIDSPFQFEFLPPRDVPHPLLKLSDVNLGYADHTLLHNIKLSLLPGDRIGLLGPNGAGKSTLIKALAGELAPLHGKREAAKNLHIGYFAQHQLEQLRSRESPLEHLQHLDKGASEQSLRNFLGGFGFVGDQALTPVLNFSGGEKARLVLAMLVYQRPNLLLLDEPTNHLDLEMRHTLTLALQDFAGAMVIVSHDRHLLRTVCDRFYLVVDGNAGEYDGDLSDYAQWLSRYRRQAESPRSAASTSSAKSSSANGSAATSTTTATVTTSSASSAPASSGDKKQKRQQGAERRKKLQPYREKLSHWEKKLADLQAKNAKLEEQLADPDLYSDDSKGRLTELLQQQTTLRQALAEAEAQWLASAEALETVEQDT